MSAAGSGGRRRRGGTRLLAPPYLEAEAQGRPQVIAELMPVGGRDARFARRAARCDHRAAGHVFVVHVGDDQVPAGAQHAGELGQYRLEAGNVDQGQRADDDIHRVAGQRQPVKLTDVELAVRDTPPRVGEHVR